MRTDRFHNRKNKLWQCGILLGLAFIVIPAFALRIVHRSHAASSNRQTLTFEDRVAAQRAIEEVYWRHRIWPKDNPQPKPPLDEVLPEAALRAKVEEYLQQSRVLEVYGQRPITAAQLQAELERMALKTRQPEILRELWAALGNDPFVIVECLARPVLAERLTCEWYEKNEDGRTKEKAKADSLQPFDDWWRGVREQMEMAATVDGEYHLPEIGAIVPCGEAWTATTVTDSPIARHRHTAVWTGSEMIVWGGVSSSPVSSAGYLSTGGRYNPATDSWTTTTTTGAPSARDDHTAVWTGSEMIVWGGSVTVAGNTYWLDTGGRYNPITNSWSSTSIIGARSRSGHTAVWTGSEMIVWKTGGGRYNPATDSWIAINIQGAPSAREYHTAVWTGSEMIVWGGSYYVVAPPETIHLDTGGRYNPVTDSWRATKSGGFGLPNTGLPMGRSSHSAVWTGNEMIIWGGYEFSNYNDGWRYNPVSDNWTAITTSSVPSARYHHTAVWTGIEMIVWGGYASVGGRVTTGGRYNPTTNTWAATQTNGAPDGREYHTAVWTENEMLIWGGQYAITNGNSIAYLSFNTGGRYTITPPLIISPTTQSFTAAGGRGNVNVTTQGNCTWVATSNANWITIVSGSSGAGDGTVSYLVAPNNIANSRTGTVTIGDRAITITQAAGIPTPVPTLTSISPTTTAAGSAPFTLMLVGTNFVNSSIVRWNGGDRATTFVSSTQLSASITAADIATGSVASVTVFNPPPSGGISNALTLALWEFAW